MRGFQVIFTPVTVGRNRRRKRRCKLQHFQNLLGAGVLPSNSVGSWNVCYRSQAVVSRGFYWEVVLWALDWREQELVGGPGARQGVLEEWLVLPWP